MTASRRGGFLIAQVHQMGGRVFWRLLRRRGIRDLNPAQGRIMFVLWQLDTVGVGVDELARRTSLGKSTLSSMLDRLEHAGLVTRSRSVDDRRRVVVARTDRDRSLEEVYRRVSDEMIGLFYEGMSEQEIDRFEGYLERIHDNLTILEAGEDQP